jgi:tetratricopeptide (TPR) repeat protein
MKMHVLLFLAACSSAVSEPSPIAVYAPGRAAGRSADQLLAEANAAWDRRAEPGKAEAAQGMYLDAAVVDGRRVEGLLGAMRAISFRIEYEKGVDREKLSSEEVQLGQWCQRRAPAEAECDYRLAIALGQQARERSSTGHDAMNRMVALLKKAAAAAPTLDEGGPHRVLALVLTRAPGWPVGPGDSEAALAEAKKAVAIAPQSAANQLVLAETLKANDDEEGALAAYRKAADLATKDAARDPEVARQLADAKSGIEKTGG